MMDLLIVLTSFLDLRDSLFFCYPSCQFLSCISYISSLQKHFPTWVFQPLEAILIVFVSFLLGSGLIDEYVGVSFSNIPLFTYHTYWMVGINAGGAVIPILLSIYLSVKNRLKPVLVLLGIGGIAVVTFFVTYPDPEKGIVSTFPVLDSAYPGSKSCVVSCYAGRRKRRLHLFAYIIGTLGVLLGADGFHLMSLITV